MKCCSPSTRDDAAVMPQMQHLGEGQHWSGQGILEGLCVDTPRFGGSNESKSAEDAFTKLLANFEEQELPSTLHQSSTLTPFRRQRKNCRPLRIPPTFETGHPIRDNNKAGLGEGAASSQQHVLKAHRNGSFFESRDKRKSEPSSPTVKEAPHVEKLIQKGIKNDCPIPTKLKFEGVLTHQENGLDCRNLKPSAKYALPNDKHSNRAVTCGAAGLNSLPYPQHNGTNPDSLCSTVCRNAACQAKISSEASFCRRCSCCICKLFDSKRDPSLWILCDPNMGGGCGLSCHIECALKQQVAGVIIDCDGSISSLDGGYYCHSCHAIIPLICCWREQLLAAKDALTLDNLHYRLFLSYRLLKGTQLYKDVHGPIEEAMKRVDAEVSQMALGLVKRLQCSVDILSCRTDVQRLISLALEKADSWSLASVKATKQTGQSMLPFVVSFEDVSSSSVVVAVNVRGTLLKPKLLGYKLWHRRASEPAYACTPTGILYSMDAKFVVSNLHPLTDYTFKVVPFCMEGDIAICEVGCSTKGTGHVEPPVDVYTSLGVLLINTERVGGGTSRCTSQSFNLDYHVDNGKNGLKIQDLEEVLVDQNEQGHHLSSKYPSIGKEQRGNCKTYEGSISVYSKRGASLKDERRGHLGQRNMATVVQEERNVHSLDTISGPSKCKQVQTGIGNSSMKMGSHLSFDCWDEKLSRKCLKTSAEQDLLSDSKQCHHTVSSDRLCSSNGNLPSQSWLKQGDGSENVTITACTHLEMELDHRSDNHKQGVFTCNSEADFHNYEFSVKVIRWLECKGHLKEEFRMKFLTWFTLKASEQEKRVISVFIDTLQDDPASLAGQLVDAFEEMIGVSRYASTLDGFCRRLW